MAATRGSSANSQKQMTQTAASSRSLNGITSNYTRAKIPLSSRRSVTPNSRTRSSTDHIDPGMCVCFVCV